LLSQLLLRLIFDFTISPKMRVSTEQTSIVPFPAGAAKKYIPIKHLVTSSEGTIYLCVAPVSSQKVAIKAFRELHFCTPLQITHLKKLKNEQDTQSSSHPSNKYFPKLHEVYNPNRQSMEAIEGAPLKDLLTLIRSNGTWGVVFTCHLFNELHAALSGLLDMDLMYMELNLENVMFRYQVDPGTNEFPRLMLVDFDLLAEEKDTAKTGLTTNAILRLCSKVCKATGSKAYPISEAAQLPDEHAKPRKFAKITAYSPEDLTISQTPVRKFSLMPTMWTS
jgi:hypothetical protein